MSDSNKLELQKATHSIVLDNLSAIIERKYINSRGKDRGVSVEDIFDIFRLKPWARVQLEDFYHRLIKEVKSGVVEPNGCLTSGKVAELLYILFGEESPKKSEQVSLKRAFSEVRQAILGKELYNSTRSEPLYLGEYRPWNRVYKQAKFSGNQISQIIVSQLYNSNVLTQAFVIKLHEVLKGLTQARFLSNAKNLQEDLEHLIELLEDFKKFDEKNKNKIQDYAPFMDPLILNTLLDRLKVREERSSHAQPTNYGMIKELMQEDTKVKILGHPKGAQIFKLILQGPSNFPYAKNIVDILSIGVMWAPECFSKAPIIKEPVSSFPLQFASFLEQMDLHIKELTHAATFEEKKEFMETLLAAPFKKADELEQLSKLVTLLPFYGLPNLSELVKSQLYRYKAVVEFFSMNRYHRDVDTSRRGIFYPSPFSPYFVSRGEDNACACLLGDPDLFATLINIANENLQNQQINFNTLPAPLKRLLESLANKIQWEENGRNEPLAEDQLKLHVKTVLHGMTHKASPSSYQLKNSMR